jgi:transcriptional regulator with XRE-family HTH domain
MQAIDQYSRTIETLKRSIEQHETPSGKMSVKAFCESYGVDRSNLTQILNGRQEISISLFIKISEILDPKLPRRAMPEGVERWSLRTWLQVDSFAIQQAMYSVNFAG